MSDKTLNSSLNSLTDHRVLDFLRLARVAHLATSSADGAPHNVPLCFWFDDGARLYFIVDEKPKLRAGTGLKRMRNIAQNPRVAIVVDHYEEEWAHLAYVLIHGDAQMVDDPNEYMLALRNLRDKYPQYRAMVLNPERNPMVRVEATHLHVWGARFKPTAPAA